MLLAILPGYNLLVPRGQAGRRDAQAHARCAAARARPAACSAGSASARRTCRPRGAIFGYRRQARDDRRLHQSRRGPARRGWVSARQLLVRALGPAGARRADPLVERRRAADALPAHRRAGLGALRQRRPARLSLGPHQRRPRATSAPTASAAKSRCSACSCPAGACTWPTSPSPRATSSGRSARICAPQACRLALRSAMSGFDTPYRGGIVGREHHFALIGLFRGHRRLRHRLLRQLSEVHGARALGHAARGRDRPGGRARARAAALMRWSRPTSATAARRGSATICCIVSTVDAGPRIGGRHSAASHARGRTAGRRRGSPPPSSTASGRPRRHPKDWVAEVRKVRERDA